MRESGASRSGTTTPRVVEAVAEAMDYKQLRLAETAGDSHTALRQQWDSANNAVALEAGVVFICACNKCCASNE